MQPGDILWSNVCTQPLAVMVRRTDGQYFDFVAGAFAAAAKPFDKARFCLMLTPDAMFPTTQRGVIPVAARQDPLAELIECVIPNNGYPQPSQTDWIAVVDGGGEGVPMGLARGAKLIFTG